MERIAKSGKYFVSENPIEYDEKKRVKKNLRYDLQDGWWMKFEKNQVKITYVGKLT